MQFEPAYQKLIVLEGGLKLCTVQGDRGGMTYCGISRKFNPDWAGWKLIDAHPETSESAELSEQVRQFYLKQYWTRLECGMFGQEVADALFISAVNVGANTAVKLMQHCCGVAVDGLLGDQTQNAMNRFEPGYLAALFKIELIKRYNEIVQNNRSQLKFLPGWINRVMKT